MRRSMLCIVLSLCLCMLSACSGDTSSASVSETSEIVLTSEVISTSEIAETETSEATSATIEEETEITETALETTAEISETTAETTEISSAESVSEITSDEVTNAETTVTTTVQTASETAAPTTAEKATETEKPRAEVIIPEIKTPLASGVSVAESDKAEIDFSCADEGYISAVYTGKSERAKLRVRCGDVQYDHDLASDGTREFFPLMGDGSYSVKVYELVTGKSYGEAVSAEFEVKIISSTGMYLYPNKYSDFDSKSESVKKAAELCVGIDDKVEKIAAIFGYVTENITYDKKLAATVTSGYIPDPDRTLENGKGICFDYASLMVAMLRSQSIPTRLVIGYAEPDIYHAWNEIYTEETGWITPELFLKKKGFNIADATFYAGNSNKEKIADYIEDESNYSAIYRY
ncbi:MAG: transglutaminase domain-containing protein [Oscillospiraceae bacterium]|nr:transglutaminase domain-containing protein [Oscillospiraceae bacterium]